jgi:tyrosine-protein kinase Etk/Wzc
MLVLWPLLAAIAAAAVSLVLPPTFTGVTTILPPQQPQSSAAAMLNQLSGLAGAAGGAFGIKNTNDLYIGMLRSNAVADSLIERFKLKELYRAKYLADARKDLAVSSRFEADKSGLIVIEVDARDPRLAAEMANAYVERLYQLTGTLAVTEASQRRVFFERQLRETKEKLAEAEVKLRQGIESGGLVNVDVQGRGTVETVARLRAQISAKQIQLEATRAYATDSNPDLRLAEQELASMRREVSRLESGTGAADRPERATAGGKGKEAASGVGNIRLVRDVKYQEVMFDLLAKQYEMARVDESKEAPLVQVIDQARPPEKRTKPKRTLMVLGAAAAGLLAALLGAFARDALESALGDPARQEKFTTLRAVWRWRRS